MYDFLKLLITEQEVINWRKKAPKVPEADPEEKKKHRAGGSIIKPEELLGQVGKEHFCRIREAANELGLSEPKVRYLLHNGLIDGVDVCKLLNPDKNLICFWIYNSSLEVYKKRYPF